MIDVLAVTGHRPDKLGGYDDDTYNKLVRFARWQLVRLEPAYVLTGMALGWDQAVAQACIDSGIRFLAYVPFVGQESIWPEYSQDRYNALLAKAHEVVLVSRSGYSPAAMQRRNEKMVDDANTLLALWNGSEGGTANCVEYADLKGIHTLHCWKRWEHYLNPPRPLNRKTR